MESRGENTSISIVLRAFQRDVLELLVFQDDVFVLTALIAFDLVLVLDLLAGDGIDIVADDAVLGLAVEGMKADLLAFGGRRHHLHRDR